MAISYNHAQIGIVDPSGNVNVIYPQTYSKDVIIEQGTHQYLIDAGITTSQRFAEIAGDDIFAIKNEINTIKKQLNI